MKKLYHYSLCPFSRQMRIVLKEFGQEFSLIPTEYWKRSPEFLKLNPAAELPILEEESGLLILGIYPCLEYSLETFDQNNVLMATSPLSRAENRRIVSWFNHKFYFEVTKYLLDEKLIRIFQQAGAPRSDLIKLSGRNLLKHLDYLNLLLSRHHYLVNDYLGIADIVAAAHLSILDFFDAIVWDNYPQVKYWYSLIKSRPSFRPLLSDHVAGFFPPKHYADPDF